VISTVNRSKALAGGGDEPLRGLRVVVTRPLEQASGFARALTALGAEVLIRPLIRVEPLTSPAPLGTALARIRDYDWVVFSSINAVGIFLDGLETAGMGPEDMRGVRVAAVGPATRDALEARAVPVDVLPGEYISEAIATALAGVTQLAGVRVLWPRAREARPNLLNELKGRGARVDAIDAYRTVPDPTAAADLRREVAAGLIDVVTFASPSTVQALAAAGPLVLHDTRVAVIGPVTGEAARACGLPVHIEAAQHTTRGLVAALREFYLRRERA
jgi:uroporphyrinogen III methyltransferase/synthase